MDPSYRCFDNCPNDSRQPSVLSTQETYCNDASVYTSSIPTPISAAVSSTGSGSAVTTTASGSGAATSAGAVQTASGTTSSSGSSASGKSGAGSNAVLGAGQVALGLAIAGVFGGALL